jgi:hypothetical protein
MERSDFYPYSKPPPAVSFRSSSLIAPEPNDPPPKQPPVKVEDSSSSGVEDPQADRVPKTEELPASPLEAPERTLDCDSKEVAEASASSPPQMQEDSSDDDSDSDYEEHPTHKYHNHRSRPSPKATRQSARKRTPLRRSPSPRSQSSSSGLGSLKKQCERKFPLACLFCRGRKIACGPPPADSEDDTCK